MHVSISFPGTASDVVLLCSVLFSEPHVENISPALDMPYVRFIKGAPKIIRKCQVVHQRLHSLEGAGDETQTWTCLTPMPTFLKVTFNTFNQLTVISCETIKAVGDKMSNHFIFL